MIENNGVLQEQCSRIEEVLRREYFVRSIVATVVSKKEIALTGTVTHFYTTQLALSTARKILNESISIHMDITVDYSSTSSAF